MEGIYDEISLTKFAGRRKMNCDTPGNCKKSFHNRKFIVLKSLVEETVTHMKLN